MRKVRYHQLAPGAEPPSLGEIEPFAAVVIIEEDVTWEWRAKISRWLVDSGCLFMMAWDRTAQYGMTASITRTSTIFRMERSLKTVSC
mgnify:CR=1 FL=1